MSKAIDDVLARRVKHLRHGYDAEHDDTHVEGELTETAVMLALGSLGYPHPENQLTFPPVSWSCPLAQARIAEGPRECLVEAAAFLLAEIERRDRAAEKAQP